jgi:hypothetical protein
MTAAQEALERRKVATLRAAIDRLHGDLATARGRVGRIEREIAELERDLYEAVRTARS